jgi:UPF0755 protein
MTNNSNSANRPHATPQTPRTPRRQPLASPQSITPSAAPAPQVPVQQLARSSVPHPLTGHDFIPAPPRISDANHPPQQQIDSSHQHRDFVEPVPQHDAGSDPEAQVAPEAALVTEKPVNFLKTRKKPHRIIRTMQFVMSVTFFIAVGLAGFVMFTRHQIDKPGPLTQDTIFEVGKGQGLSTISARLQESGIINNKRIFAMNAIASKAAKKLKAGKYSIPKKASMQKVLSILVKGKAIFYRVTLPEGWTSQQIVNALNAHPQLVGTINAVPPEGSLMPDTFQFSEGENRNKLIDKMTTAQANYLDRLWAERQPDLPFKTKEEALILASIVEKETGRSSERKRVAGIFINRLRKGMKLQSDPTIIYGLVGGKGKLGHPLRRSEMNKKTAFNTYQIPGLPPTPIANPGRKSIEAVLNPAKTKDLYFVADGTGGHAFAPNIKLHNKNVRKWREVEAERRREQKRRESEQKKLAVLEKKKTKSEKNLPGIIVRDVPETAPKSALPMAVGANSPSPPNPHGWSNNIPLPVRKPH